MAGGIRFAARSLPLLRPCNRIVELPDVKDRLAQNGLTSQRNSPAELAAFVRAEIPKFAKAVKDSGAKVD